MSRRLASLAVRGQSGGPVTLGSFGSSLGAAGGSGSVGVTPPSPTLRGVLASNTAATSFVLTPSSTPLGEVMLQIGITDGTNITAPPVITGGGAGVTWAFLPPRGNESATGGSTRATFLYWGHGTFDATAITCTPADGLTDECTMHLIDWANAKTSKPFTHVQFTTLLNGNSTSVDCYQQRRIGATNALGGFVFNGTANQPHTLSEGTVLQHSAASGYVLSITSFWHNTDFTGYKHTTSGFGSSSSGGHLYEVLGTGSDDGPTANVRPILDWTDASGNIVTAAFTAKANEVVVFAAVTEKAADSQGFTSVVDGSSNAYTQLSGGRINVDADHSLHVYAFRYGASPPAGTTITATFPGTLIGSVGVVVGLLKENGTGMAGSTNTDWLVQLVSSVVVAGTSISATVPSIAQRSSVLAFVGRDSATADFVFEQGWVPVMAQRDDIAGKGFETECVLAIWLGGDEDNTPSVTCSSGDLGIIALEVA